MQIAAPYDPIQAFMASRDAAVKRMSTVSGNGIRPETGKFLTGAPRPVDPVTAVQSANGPVKGRHLDLVA